MHDLHIMQMWILNSFIYFQKGPKYLFFLIKTDLFLITKNGQVC